MNTAMRSWTISIATAAFAFAWPSLSAAQTEQLSVLPESAAAMGMIGGRLANVVDPSQLRYSPTMILDLARPDLQVNAGVWRADVKFASPTGATVELEDPTKYLGSVYYVYPIKPGELAFGIGLSTPFGLSFDYPRDSFFKYVLPYNATLLTLDISPTLAWRMNNQFAVAAGIDIVYSSLTLNQDFPWVLVTGIPGTPDGQFQFKGHGWGVTGFLGIRFDPTPKQRIVVTGHLPLSIDYDGEFRAGGLPPPLKALGYSDTSSFKSRIKYPGKVSVGYGIDVTDDLKLGVDFEWAQNSVHKDLPLDIGNNQPLLGTDRLILNWRDSYSVGVGAQWYAWPNTPLRAGYMYTSSSMPDETFTPAVASNARHIFSAGFGYKRDKSTFDFAYSYVRMEDRHVQSNQQPAFIGDYKFSWNIFTLSYRYSF
jgi:long-chain fatty acid transport protein